MRGLRHRLFRHRQRVFCVSSCCPPQTKYLGCYLCEKIGPMESLVACDTTPGAGPHFPFLRDVARPIAARPMDNQGRVLLCAECCAELQLQWDAFESAGLPLAQRRYHTAHLTSPPSASQGACFVCTEPTSETFPVGSREGPGPFFPFLESHAGQGALDSTGTARVCTFCFHSLMAQWLAYESSPHPEDAARAARRYNTHHYVCYICGITTYRRRVRTLTVREFPFLREHPRPAGALTLRDGVVSCLTCFESLSSQWRDYERMRVPVEMRKYNWIVLPPPPEETRSGGSSPSGQEQAFCSLPLLIQCFSGSEADLRKADLREYRGREWGLEGAHWRGGSFTPHSPLFPFARRSPSAGLFVH
ncbi:hypothetical protein MTO96_019101 [Rhipicephalus appendiculatus]